ncbi:serine dehydrogenasease [Acidithiobacillus ferrivorans]|nr:serine dehydrogenasease [Acidithiobacillus ferrivorans]
MDEVIESLINGSAKELERILDGDVICYFGAISPSYVRPFRNFIENIKDSSKVNRDRLEIILRTPGGSVETAERFVDVIRHHYNEIYFIIPDMAMSAGTIWCMSGDKIYMDYASSLGPIDPQVMAGDGSGFVPALGYLDKVEEITNKAYLSEADVVFLKGIDLAKLGLFEQAKELSVELLKTWLVKYKFRTWSHHRTNGQGDIVSDEEKMARAQQIAETLSDNTRWHSHGRNIDIKRVSALKLEIEDYSFDQSLKDAIRNYNDPLTSYADRMGIRFLLHHHSQSL